MTEESPFQDATTLLIETLLSHTSDIVITLEKTSSIIGMNARCSVLTGISSGEIRGRPFDTMVCSSDRPALDRTMNAASVSDSPVAVSLRLLTSEGGALPVDFRMIPISGGVGEKMYLLIGQDASRDGEYARMAMERDKIETIGRLTGGVAHDFNNFLTVMKGNAELARLKLSGGEDISAELEEIIDSANHAAQLTRQLLVFTRQHSDSPVTVDVNDLMSGIDKMLRRLIGENNQLVILMAEGLWPVRISPGHLEQVIFMLIVDARGTVPSGGTITVETWNGGDDVSSVNPHHNISGKGSIHIRVTARESTMGKQVSSFPPDNPHVYLGIGGGDTPDGLESSREIIRKYGGRVEAETTKDGRRSVHITLPRAGEVAGISIRGEWAGRGETVLLVEDEPRVHDVASRILERGGYRVLRATNGEEALRAINEVGTKAVDLVLSDVVMPRMGGRELYESIRGMDLEIPVLFMSGYTDDSLVRTVIAGDEVSFLPKPFLPSQLLERVRQVIDEARDIRVN